MKDIYKEDWELMKHYNRMQYTVHAEKVISELFGNTIFTRFELYQALHKALPHLKHIVHNRSEQSWRLIFIKSVDLVIDIKRYEE